LTASITAGVAALVAINSFTDNLRLSVREQARSMLGADLSFSSNQAFSAKVNGLVDSLGAAGLARVTTFGAMAYMPRATGVRLAQVSGVDGPFPFYGEVVTEPDTAWRTLQAGARAIVDPSLLAALGARIGDTVALGQARFVLWGTLTRMPGDVGVRSAFGPRIFIPNRYVPATGLLEFGARVQREAFVRLAPDQSAQAIATRYRPSLRTERVRIRTVADDRQNLDDALARLGNYLGLVALIALLLGGLGVASATHVFVRQKTEAIAVLRCLGATAGQVFAIYVAQAAAMGLLGSIAGALLGIGIQQLLPHVIGGVLPVEVSSTPSWPAVLVGIGTGIWVATAFAMLPLLSTRRVAPLAALRQVYDPAGAPREPWRWPVLALIAASVFGLASVQAESWRTGASFAGAIGIAVVMLWIAAWLLVRAVRRWLPARWPYVWRQGLANLHRPANQTMAVVLALGFGAFLLATLFLAQYNLLRELQLAGGSARPNLVLFDIQPDQLASITREMRASGFPATMPVPIVPMRIASIRGKPISQVPPQPDTLPRRAGRGRPGGGWALRREYRSTWRDVATTSEKIVTGKWWKPGRTASDTGAVPISVESDVAGDLGVRLGDEIVWDVQGVPVRTRIANLRDVDWARFEPNFFVVFASGALEQAPRTYVLLTRIDQPAARGGLQRRLAERYPNVTTLDVAAVQESIERLVSRVILAIRFMAFFSLITGAIVLAGAVSTSRHQRVREGALLKTLGATRRQVLQVVLAEYVALGVLSAAAALVLAIGSGWALAFFLFDLPFRLPLASVAALVGSMALLAVIVGLWGSLEVVRRTPLEVLRNA
ncbi:MAG: FtsX-like permease family protein, partial [Gemmatimonadales bacterium]|nr:FtsX-like permease family protein [Gemmatimonadales bacterium]